MKTEHLEYLIDIAVSGSLSKTADRFFTSHQVVKKAIKHLENELHVKLIDTNNQGTVLTEAGHIFLLYSQKVLQLTGDLKQELVPFTLSSNDPKKKIAFCMTPYLTDSLILSFIDEYQSHHPDISLELQSLPVQNMYEQIVYPYSIFILPTIKEATLDAQFNEDLQRNGLNFFVLAERMLFICTYEKTKYAQNAHYTSADLDELPILISSNITLNMNFTRNKKQQLVNSIVAQKNLIKKGVGVALVTEKEFAFYFKNDSRYRLIPIDLPPIWYICVHKKNAIFPEHVDDFLKQLELYF